MRNRGIRAALCVVVLALVGSMSPAPVHAGGLTNGLAVAVTADGSRLVAGGSNRVLYELDPETLEVKGRSWLGRQIMNLLFSPDGKVLVVESTKVIQWLRADTMEPFHTMKDANRMRAVPALNAVAVDVGGFEPGIKLFSFDDAKEVASVPYDRRQNVAAFGVSPDGKTLALLHYRRKHGGETKVAWKDIPEDIKRDRASPVFLEYQQRNDGYGAMFRIVDIPSGEVQLEKNLWFSANGSGNLIAWLGGHAHVVGYHNECAKIDKEGEVTFFVLKNSFNYAYHATPDGKVLWTGGLRDGCRTDVASLSSTPFELDELPGFPEYFKLFTVAADGTAFAGTTAFRVVRLGADGAIQKIEPIY